MESQRDDEAVVIGYPIPSTTSHPSTKEPPKKLSKCQKFGCTILLLIVLLTILGMCEVTISMVEKKTEWSVSSASVASFNLSSSIPTLKISATFDVNLSVHNPAFHGITYTNIHAAVVYGGVSIVAASLPKFYQPKHAMTDNIRFGPVSVVNENLDPEAQWGITWSLASDKSVVFGFNLTADTVARPSFILTEDVNIHCDGIIVWFANGTTEATSKKCLRC